MLLRTLTIKAQFLRLKDRFSMKGNYYFLLYSRPYHTFNTIHFYHLSDIKGKQDTKSMLEKIFLVLETTDFQNFTIEDQVFLDLVLGTMCQNYFEQTFE